MGLRWESLEASEGLGLDVLDLLEAPLDVWMFVLLADVKVGFMDNVLRLESAWKYYIRSLLEGNNSNSLFDNSNAD